MANQYRTAIQALSPKVRDNPWFEMHLSAEFAYQQGVPRANVVALVASEFIHGPEPMVCDCGSQAWWRPTVGAFKCPDCNALFHHNGERV